MALIESNVARIIHYSIAIYSQGGSKATEDGPDYEIGYCTDRSLIAVIAVAKSLESNCKTIYQRSESGVRGSHTPTGLAAHAIEQDHHLIDHLLHEYYAESSVKSVQRFRWYTGKCAQEWRLTFLATGSNLVGS